MKAVFLSLFFLITAGLFAQQDTTFVDLRHNDLDEVLIIDSWEIKDALKSKVDFQPLEVQLKQIQGVNLVSRGSFAQELVYRGQRDGRIQVRVNGMRIYNACTDRMDPSTSYLVSNNLQNAELGSSCESSCTANGLAGNFNLKTKEACLTVKDSFKFGLAQQYLSNTRGLNSSFFFENSGQKFAWRLNGTWFKNENYRDGRGQEILYSQNQKQNWSLNAIYRLSAKQFITLDLIYDLAINVGYPSLPMDVSAARGLIGGITFKSYHSLGPFQNYELKLYHNDIYHEMDDTQREDVFMHMDMPGWSRTSGLSFNALNWEIGNHTIKWASEYFSNYRRAEMTMFPDNGSEPPMFMLTWPDARLHGLGTGISGHFHWGLHQLQASFRLDYERSYITDKIGRYQWIGMGYEMDQARSFLLPQISLNYSRLLTKKQKLKLALSYGKRAATTSELYGFYLFNAHDGYDYLGHANLKAETLTSAEASYIFNAPKLTISSAVFVQLFSDYIFGLNTNYDAMTYGANGVRAYANVGRATFYGFEVLAEYNLHSNWKLKASSEYIRGFRPQFDLPLIPPFQTELGINYSIGKWSMAPQLNYAAAQNHINSSYGDRYTPAYFLLDFAVNYRFKMAKGNALLSLALNNLTDRYYRDHMSWAGIPSMGRNVSVAIKYGL